MSVSVYLRQSSECNRNGGERCGKRAGPIHDFFSHNIAECVMLFVSLLGLPELHCAEQSV